MEEQLKHYSNKPAYEIDSSDLMAALENGESVVVVDARSPQAYAAGHILGAINILLKSRSAILAPWSMGIGCLFRAPQDSTTQPCPFRTACPNRPNSA